MIKDINLAIQKCHKNKVYVYPIQVSGKWYIERSYNGKKHVYDKEISKDQQSEAMNKTYTAIANKL